MLSKISNNVFHGIHDVRVLIQKAPGIFSKVDRIVLPLLLAIGDVLGKIAPRSKNRIYQWIEKRVQNPIKGSKAFETQGVQQPHCYIGGINGMNTSSRQAQEHAVYLKKLALDHKISWVYNRSHGAPADLAEVFALNYLGYSPNTASLLLKNWRAFDEANKDCPDAKLLQFCHSQGSIHVNNALKRASPELCNRVIVVAIAPAKVISPSRCFKAMNYASKKDFVPKAEVLWNFMQDKLCCRKPSQSLQEALRQYNHLTRLKSKVLGMDHKFQSPTFKPVIEKIIQDYLACGGIYPSDARKLSPSFSV